MHVWAARASTLMVLVLAAIYFGAKLHFWLYGDRSGYFEVHWLFWAGALVVALLGRLFYTLGKEQGGSSGESKG